MWTQDNTPEIMLEAETIQDENKFEENVKKKRSRRRRRGRNPAEDSTSGPSTLQPTATDVKSELPLQNEEENKLEGHVKKKRSRRRRRGKYPTEDSTTPGPAQDQSIISVEGNKDGCLTEISASSNTDGISAVSSAINTNDENSIVKSSNTEKKKRRRNRRKRPMSSQGGGDNELALENVGSSQLVNEGNLNVEGIGNGKIEVKDFDDIDGNSGAGCASVATDAGEQSLVMSSSTERKKRRRRNKRRRASASQGNGEVETQSTNDVNSNMTNLDGVNATHDTSLNINNFDGIQSINVVNSTMINMDGMQNVGAINSECNLNVSTADGMEVQERRRAKRRNRKRNKKRASTTEGDDVAQMSETVASIEPTIVSDQPAKKRRRKRKRNNSVPVDMAEAANVTNEENAEISDGNMKKIKLSPNDDVLPTEENIGGSVSSQQKKNKRNRNRRRRAKKDFKDKQDNNAESIIDSQENGDGILKAADSDLKDGEETSGKFNTEGDMDDTKDECCTTQPLQQANNNQTNKRKRKRNRRRKGKQSVVESESDAQTPGVTHTGETPHNGTESAHLSEEGISRVFDEEFDSPAVKKMRKDDQISTSIINGSAAPATVELAAVYADEEYKNKIKKHWSEGKGQFCEGKY
nr:micronuclear linker histone polyprotein-like isoform X1 [Procambarus clarkii]